MRDQPKVTSVTLSLLFSSPASQAGVDSSPEIWIGPAASSPQGRGFARAYHRAIGEKSAGWASALHDSPIDRWFYLALLAVLTLWCSLMASGCGNAAAAAAASSNDTGSGSSSSIVISTGSVAFGSVVIGQTASASVSVTNRGASAIELSAPQITGQYFSLAGQSAGTVSLDAGSSQTFNLEFAPLATGAQTGSMILAAGTETLTVSLSGTGTAAPGVLNGLTCTSGSMTGSGTDSCKVTLNAAAGTGGLTVGLGSSSTAVSVPASVTVPAAATSAKFTATVSVVTTAEAAQLTATVGTVTESYTIQLGAAVPGLTLQSTSVSFGDVSLNSPATQMVLLTSSGTAPLTISAVSVQGAGFSLTAGGSAVTLQPGQTATLAIQFDPTATGTVTGAVALTTNSGTATISLSGTGAAAGTYEVDLNWNAPTDSSDPVAGYDIYRAVSGSSSYALLNSNVDDLATFADTTVQSGTSYTYYVVSVDASGNQSAPSNLFTATVP